MTVVAIAAFPACAGSGAGSAAPAPSSAHAGASSTAADTTGLIPAGFGSLHQEDITISVSANGLSVEAKPLDDNFIRTLAPDSYTSLLRVRESKRASIDSIARRTGAQSLSLWYFTFRNVQSGEAPFSPRDVVITNQNRDFKPLDAIGVTPGFGEQRVRQGQTHVGILVFEGGVNPNQTLTLTIGTQGSGSSWQAIVQRVELERARIRSRAGARGSGGAPSQLSLFALHSPQSW